MDRSLSVAADLSERVRLGVRISYALPALASAVVGIPVYVYMPKSYTDVMGLSVATRVDWSWASFWASLRSYTWFWSKFLQ